MQSSSSSSSLSSNGNKLPIIPLTEIVVDRDSKGCYVKIASSMNCAIFPATYKGKRVVMKRMYDIDRQGQEKFSKEIGVLERIREPHPNIITTFGWGFHKTSDQNHDMDWLYLIMEYLPMGSLFSVLHETTRKISNASRWQIARDMACALFHLHSRHILHKDIKSMNFMVYVDVQKPEILRVKCIDFGESKCKLPATKTTASDVQKVGTLRWMAPEVIKEHKYTQKSDIYSYGMVLWELVTRQIPYENMNDFEVAGRILDNVHPLIPKGTPLLFKNLIELCWRMDVDKRPAAKDLAATFIAQIPSTSVTQKPNEPNQESFYAHLEFGMLSAAEQELMLQFMLEKNVSFQATLNLAHCTVLTDDMLEQILRNSQNLRGLLDISFCEKLTDKSISIVAKYCPQLRNLSASALSQLTAAGSQVLNFANLEQLYLTGCSNLTSLIINAPKLRYLNIAGCNSLGGFNVQSPDVHIEGFEVLNQKTFEQYLLVTKKFTQQELNNLPKEFLQNILQYMAMLSLSKRQSARVLFRAQPRSNSDSVSSTSDQIGVNVLCVSAHAAAGKTAYIKRYIDGAFLDNMYKKTDAINTIDRVIPSVGTYLRLMDIPFGKNMLDVISNPFIKQVGLVGLMFVDITHQITPNEKIGWNKPDAYLPNDIHRALVFTKIDLLDPIVLLCKIRELINFYKLNEVYEQIFVCSSKNGFGFARIERWVCSCLGKSLAIPDEQIDFTGTVTPVAATSSSTSSSSSARTSSNPMLSNSSAAASVSSYTLRTPPSLLSSPSSVSSSALSVPLSSAIPLSPTPAITPLSSAVFFASVASSASSSSTNTASSDTNVVSVSQLGFFATTSLSADTSSSSSLTSTLSYKR